MAAEPRPRLRRAAAAAALALTALAAPARAAPRFERVALARHDLLLGVASRELDAASPGLELLVVSAKRLGPHAFQRHLTLYRWAPGPQGASPQLWRELEVPDDVVAYAVGDLLGQGAPQILYITPASVFALALASGSAPVRVLEHRFFATAPAPAELPLWDGVRDLDGDGRADLLLPDPRGYSVYRQQPGGGLQRTSHLEPGSSYASEPSSRRVRRLRSEGALRQTRALTQLTFAELDADGRPDLLALDEDDVLGFAQGPELRFAAEPSFRSPLLRAAAGASASFGGGQRGRRSAVAFGDVDADGRTDFVVPDLDAGDLVTRLRLFLSGAQGPPAQPSQILKLSSLGGEPELIDIDGDGRLDLGCATVRTDRLQRAGAAAQRIDFTYYGFLFRSEARAFSASPDLEWDVSVEIPADKPDTAAREAEADDEEGLRSGLLSMGGDFDGDGVRDLLALSPGGELRVFPASVAGGERRGVRLAAEPLLQAAERPASELRIEDVDGDGSSDALLRYPESLVLLVSRR